MSATDVYDQQTGEAVARLYKSKGFEPFGPTPAQIAAMRTLERDMAEAARARVAAESAVATSGQAISAARAAAHQANQDDMQLYVRDIEEVSNTNADSGTDPDH